MLSSSIEESIKLALSEPRLGTYEVSIYMRVPKIPLAHQPVLDGAISLYSWNAQISAAFLHPLHICEVVMRNVVSSALTSLYGDRWPWSSGFEQSLPAIVPHSPHFSLLREINRARKNQLTTGKVIAELKMMFWQTMFTARFDGRVWNRYLNGLMPNHPGGKPHLLRNRIFDDLEHLRVLRNRIAHHEPIFKRQLSDDLEKIRQLIELRCDATAAWMIKHQQVTDLIAKMP